MKLCLKSIYLATKVPGFKQNNVVHIIRKHSTYAERLALKKSRNGKTVEIDGMSLYYEKVGNGDHPVLFLPGAHCSTVMDFNKQFEHLNLEKFTLLGLDLPGYGLSRPPERKYSLDMFDDDALIAHKFMKTLNYDKFSLFGWSASGTTAMVLASKFPDSILKLAVSSAYAYITQKDIEVYKSTEDIRTWLVPRSTVQCHFFYDTDEECSQGWEKWKQTCIDLYRERNGVICRNLKNITCPTLIFSGKKDSCIDSAHPFYLNEQITNSKCPGSKVEVDGLTIHYEKVGAGSHPVLLLPGALGTTQTDFKPQLDNLNRDKLTVIAWDPPGYGYSRPPDRNFHMEMFTDDAIAANSFMKKMNYSEFSVIGWSDGGITALYLASMFPQSIKKMLVFGANTHITEEDSKLYEKVRDVEKWSDRMREPMVKIYGMEYFKKSWESWCNTFAEYANTRGGNICNEKLKDITCPTLIIHGQKDAMVVDEHPHHLHKHIKNSKLKMYPDGKHNLHLKYWKEFNKDAEDFLIE